MTDLERTPAPRYCQCEHVHHLTPQNLGGSGGCSSRPAELVQTGYGLFWLCLTCLEAAHMAPVHTRPEHVVEVRKRGRTWDVYQGGVLVEGGFFSYDVACQEAQARREQARAGTPEPGEMLLPCGHLEREHPDECGCEACAGNEAMDYSDRLNAFERHFPNVRRD